MAEPILTLSHFFTLSQKKHISSVLKVGTKIAMLKCTSIQIQIDRNAGRPIPALKLTFHFQKEKLCSLFFFRISDIKVRRGLGCNRGWCKLQEHVERNLKLTGERVLLKAKKRLLQEKLNNPQQNFGQTFSYTNKYHLDSTFGGDF